MTSPKGDKDKNYRLITSIQQQKLSAINLKTPFGAMLAAVHAPPTKLQLSLSHVRTAI
jgi:hypothetical protein